MTQLETLRRIAGRDPRYRKYLPPGVEPIPPEDGRVVAARPARTIAPPPCALLGEPTGETRPCQECSRTTQVPLRACAKHGVCSESKLVTLADGQPVKCCSICADRQAAKSAPFRWVSTAQLATDAALLAGKLPHDLSGIVGIPRSGLIPAAIVAAHLHLPLWRLAEDGSLHSLGHGSRGRNDGLAGKAGQRLAVIDDTVYGGAAMRLARKNLRGIPALFAAVYVRPEARASVDVSAVELPSPHLLEWNLLNNGPFAGYAANAVYGKGLALDFDGIVCHDAESGGAVGSPYLLPRAHPCRLIATGRQERSRAVTEAWLRQHGVRWERLEMLPDSEPFTAEAAAAHKARHYKASGCGFFVESDPGQAEHIHRLSGKPVICPRAARVWQ